MKGFTPGRPLVSHARRLASLQYNGQIKKLLSFTEKHSHKK